METPKSDDVSADPAARTDRIAVAAIAALPPTLTAIAAVAAALIGLANRTSIAEVHTLTNSNLSRLTSANAVLVEKIEGQDKLIAKLVEDKAVADRAELAGKATKPTK